MAFNPLEERGTPVSRQFRNWDELNIQTYDPQTIHPYTRTRIILMNGIEVEGIMFGHQFARQAADTSLKQQLALTRRIEQQQQKMVNWLPPADETALQVTIGYEQVAVDLTAVLARHEPDQYVRAALDFALLEDFDHLYRYANLLEMTEGKKAEEITGGLTEIMPGRPTVVEHRNPLDSIRHHYDKKKAGFLTKLHVLTITSGEQQTMNFYMNVGNRAETRVGRGLYLEIAQIEEQHVSHYESLADPTESLFDKLVLHEYNECFMYYSCLTSEPDERIRGLWEQQLDFEIEHLRVACEAMKKYEGRDPVEFLPAAMPEPLVVFESNKSYVRKVLAEQIDLTAKDSELVPFSDRPPRYDEFQEMVNDEVAVPSQEVISRHIDRTGRDYRHQTEGEHPVKRLRSRGEVTV
jgi:hypothetical protein